MFGFDFFGNAATPPPTTDTAPHQATVTVQATNPAHAAHQGAMITEIIQWLTPAELAKLHTIFTTRPLARKEIINELRKA